MTEGSDRLWAVFERWCVAHDLTALPATEATVGAWVADRPRKEASVRTYAWAIRKVHLDAGHPDPAASVCAPGLDGRRARARIRRVPILTRVLRALPVSADERSVRSRTMVLLTYCGGLDLNEARSLTWDQVEFHPDGLVIATDTGPAVVGRGLHADSDPLRAVLDWMMLTGTGCVFPSLRDQEPLSHEAVRRLMRKLGGVGFSSLLPLGLADDALREGLPDDVVRRHIDRDLDVERRFADNLVRRVGL